MNSHTPKHTHTHKQQQKSFLFENKHGTKIHKHSTNNHAKKSIKKNNNKNKKTDPYNSKLMGMFDATKCMWMCIYVDIYVCMYVCTYIPL